MTRGPRWFLAGFTIGVLFFCTVRLVGQGSPEGPKQPIPFSHKTHAGTLEIECSTCHPNPDPGEMAGIAPASLCMECHIAVATKDPGVQALAQAVEEEREIDWVRIYEIPGYVWFSHRAHAETGNTCGECHGPVSRHDRLFREGDVSMAGCVNCHLSKGASVDCAFCHVPLE